MGSFITLLNAIFQFLISSWGLLAGVMIYVIQQFFVPQILEYREILKRARYDVIYYANIFPLVDKAGRIINDEEIQAARKELRVMGSRIRAHRSNVPFYTYISISHLVPTYQDTEKIATGFIGWCNEMYQDDSGKSARQIFRKQVAKGLSMRESEY